MAVTKAKPAPRLATREEPAPRMMAQAADRLPARDDVIRNRKGEPVGIKVHGNEDKFSRAILLAPEGWTYEWKRKNVYGWEDTQHQTTLAMNAWEAVPASRHDGEFMPKGYPGSIELDGMILMERDARLTAQARALEKRAAQNQLMNARQMAVPGAEIADFNHPDAKRVSGVKVGRQPTLPDRNYSYTVEE
jgi:hypothetical protein